MPYLSKLTKRLALGISLVLAASACADTTGDLATDPLATLDTTTGEARTPVSTVVLSPIASSIFVGGSVDLDASTLNSRGRILTNRTVSWKSSDSLVAGVDSRGVVSGRNVGVVTITATSEGQSGAASVAVVGGIVSAPPTAPTDLSLVSAGTTSATIRFTAVSDGAGGSANYALLIGSPTVTFTGDLSGAIGISGSVVGATLSYTIGSLSPGRAYQAIVVSLRGTLAVEPVVGAASSPLSFNTAVDAIGAAPFFSDNFDTGVRLASNGFLWKSANPGVAVSTNRAYSGAYALEFRYGPDLPTEDSSAEQRFDLGRNLGEVWIEYMLFVPANFIHRSESPSNDKFFMIWNTTYGSGSGTWQAGYEYQRGGDYLSNLRPMSSKESGELASYVTSSQLGHPDHNRPFIGSTSPLRPGTWSRVRMQYSRSTSAGATDGIMRLWVNGELIAEMTNGAFRNLNNVGETVLRNGYFMGWANSGFTQDTRFYIDDVRFFSSNPGW